MRVGIVGAGRMGQVHARALAELADGVSLSVYDADAGAAERLARALGGPVGPCPDGVTVRHSLDELVGASDALVVATPATRRSGPLLAAARAGLPVFCEKPLAAGVGQARELAEALTGAGARIHVGFQRRCDPEYQLLREEIMSGRLGRILMVRCTAFDHAPPAAGYEQGAGDIFTDCLIHDMDAVQWLTGQAVVAVQADGVRRLGDTGAVPGDAGTIPGGPGGPGSPGGQGGGYDVATAVLTLADGARAVLTASRLDPHGYDHRVEVLGTLGSLSVGLGDRTPLRLVRTTGEGAAAEPAPQSAFMDFTDRFRGAYRAEMHAFLQLAAHGGPSVCTVREALLAQEVADAAGRSARDGVRVALSSGPGLPDASGPGLPHVAVGGGYANGTTGSRHR
ncbi:Gfo/Idh/MocA family oxidoreductase [Streptomyces sp. NPDC017529]|uniref:Gfo/Idh/MocA family oxidoreductase n=1 Tax=Streptomyces sp. NPDC017529 TaxID=3365000 RepID=UPI0037960D92